MLLNRTWKFKFHAGNFPEKWVDLITEAFLMGNCQLTYVRCEVLSISINTTFIKLYLNVDG